jgi:hypothetical protein
MAVVEADSKRQIQNNTGTELTGFADKLDVQDKFVFFFTVVLEF